MATKQDFVNKGREIEKAMRELSAIWDELENQEITEVSVQSYPFAESFEEMPNMVCNWLDEIEGK